MNTNVTIRDDQKERLRAIALATGVTEDELIRQGIDLLIAERQPVAGDWRAAARGIYGMWKDRDDLDDIFSSFRQGFEDRHKRLFSDERC
jgi:hypothetical protein